MTRPCNLWASLVSDRAGIAMTEFALGLPILLLIGFYGLEVSNLALTNLRVSQIASNLADTAARVGEASGLARTQIRETDINDVFQAVRLQAGGQSIAEKGRIILSSLERNAEGGQWIHWQRCIGEGRYESSYGDTTDGVTGTDFPGMGRAGEEIQAPADTAIMFAEVSVPYQPLISNRLVGTPIIRAKAAYMVRQPRELANANNPANPNPAADAQECTEFNP